MTAKEDVPMDERAAEAEAKLKPCPFCQGKARIERIGTMRQSCVIVCEDCGCLLESGEVWTMGEKWNRRYHLP